MSSKAADQFAGCQFASPHSYRSVRNSQTQLKHLFAGCAKSASANSQTGWNVLVAKFAGDLVSGFSFSLRIGILLRAQPQTETVIPVVERAALLRVAG